MKKVFYSVSFKNISIYVSFFAAFSVIIWYSKYLIIVLFKSDDIVSLLVYFILVSTWVLVFGSLTISDMFNRIIFRDEVIVVTGGLPISANRMQYPDVIFYSNIKCVKLIRSRGNSLRKKRPFDQSNRRSGTYSYLEFTLEDGHKRLIFTECYRKKDIEKMLILINEKTGLSLNYKKMKEELSHKKTKKK